MKETKIISINELKEMITIRENYSPINLLVNLGRYIYEVVDNNGEILTRMIPEY
jgi:hypothetical protein